MSFNTREVDIDARTDQGRQRTSNQDSVGRADEAQVDRSLRERYGRLYLVADGVGGNADGADASRLVVEHVIDTFYYDPDLPDNPEERLPAAIKRATNIIHDEANRRRNNMRSTVVAAVVHQDRLIIANVGDSPAFLIRPGQAPKQLTVAHIHRGKNGSKGALAQAMGDEEVFPAKFATAFQADDIVVLCSDGLTDLLAPDEIAAIVTRYPAEQATKHLIREANKRGGHDNISVVVVRNGPPPAVVAPEPQTAVNPHWLLVGGAVVIVVAAMIGAFLLFNFLGADEESPPVAPPGNGAPTIATSAANPDNNPGASIFGGPPTATLAGMPSPTPSPEPPVPTKPPSGPQGPNRTPRTNPTATPIPPAPANPPAATDTPAPPPAPTDPPPAPTDPPPAPTNPPPAPTNPPPAPTNPPPAPTNPPPATTGPTTQPTPETTTQPTPETTTQPTPETTTQPTP
ncbi:hypothetical protein A6A03_19320 [Chloroflexus islandicus]|uniref:PPM-type phosphatase domain-containing protein n=1 Tax=Chloroflexus islandicus TaxID=1707952 RepID=A0A178M0E1_9CHLR|nr:protein phosphatase 2C domain-containing protein [Chloroflexus islandicus]OAN40822.1 hypothetical protein A6A03_19320 [Chloroflexus islandicus]